MGLQARMSATDNRLYDPGRDLAHCFADVVRETNDRLLAERWPFLARFRKTYHVTDRDVGLVARAFGDFVAAAADSKRERSPAAVLARVGFFDAPEAAQFAYTALLGTVVMGYFFNGAKHATIGGAGPCDTAQDLRAGGRRTAQLMALPRWRRRLVLLGARLGGVCRAARSAWASDDGKTTMETMLSPDGDGTRVTTPVFVGPGPVPAPCQEHDWAAQGIPHRVEEEGVTIRLEQCTACHWVRSRVIPDRPAPGPPAQ